MLECLQFPKNKINMKKYNTMSSIPYLRNFTLGSLAFLTCLLIFNSHALEAPLDRKEGNLTAVGTVMRQRIHETGAKRVHDIEAQSERTYFIPDVFFPIFDHLNFTDLGRCAQAGSNLNFLVNGYYNHRSLQAQIEIRRTIYFNMQKASTALKMGIIGAVIGLIPSNAESGILFGWGLFRPLPFSGIERDFGIVASVVSRMPIHVSRIGSAYPMGLNLLKKNAHSPWLVKLTIADAFLNKALPYTYMSATILTDFPIARAIFVPPLFVSNFSKGLEPKDSVLKRLGEGRRWFDMRDSHNQPFSRSAATLSFLSQIPVSAAKSSIIYYILDGSLKGITGSSASTFVATGGSIFSAVVTCLLNSDDLVNVRAQPKEIFELGMGLVIASTYMGLSYNIGMNPYLMIFSLYPAEAINEALSVRNQLQNYIMPTLKLWARKVRNFLGF